VNNSNYRVAMVLIGLAGLIVAMLRLWIGR
jgi:hypothetical protein